MNTVISKWMKQIEQLSKIAKYEPHLAYAAFVGGMKHRFNFLMRTVTNIENNLKKLDLIIDEILIPSLTNGRKLSRDERKLFSLPASCGGLGISIPSETSKYQFDNSILITEQLKDNV